MKKLAYLSALIVFVFCASCGGQNKTDLPKDTIKTNTKDTTTAQMPNSMVRNVKQARNGDILIASFKGVFRYDPSAERRSDTLRASGKSFTNLTNKISSPSFWDVLEDRKGNIWTATRDSGVYYYDSKLGAGQSFQHFTTNEGLASNTVMRIYEDRAGNIWFGTGGGVSRYDPNQAGGKAFQNFTTEDGLASNNINTIVEDKTGKLWIGTRGDVSVYDPSATLRAGGKTFTTPTNKDGKAFYNVWGITEDRKGNIWFGASIIEDKKGSTLVLSSGLWRYDGKIFTKVSDRGAYAIIEDKKGDIWTTGEVKLNGNWALTRYDQKSLYDKNLTFTEIMSLKGPGALCGILEANDGSIWFGYLGPKSGVYRYDPSASLRAGGKNITDFKSVVGQ